jgi:hypothetical protein
MEPAGTIVAQVPASAIWADCDGTYVSGWLKRDYHARCGAIAGMRGYQQLRKPLCRGWSIRLVDAPGSPDPPGNGYSITNLPPDWILTIDWVNDGVASGGIATVIATAACAPTITPCTFRVMRAGALVTGPFAATPTGGTALRMTATVSTGAGNTFELWADARPSIVTTSNPFLIL